MTRQTPSERFLHLHAVISSRRFLDKVGLGNEVPFFIYPFPPAEMIEVESLVQQLTKRLTSEGVRSLRIDLYDLAVEILQSRGIWDRLLDKETVLDKTVFREQLQGALDPERHLIPAIAERMEAQPHDVMFLTGVGAVYPYIRSHTVLNNLQSTAKEAPTVLFFPGSYTHSDDKGANLNLFGRLPNDRYYRAFNLEQFQI